VHYQGEKSGDTKEGGKMQGDLEASKIWQNQGLIAQHLCSGCLNFRLQVLQIKNKFVVS
jgi:hypothetical protein